MLAVMLLACLEWVNQILLKQRSSHHFHDSHNRYFVQQPTYMNTNKGLGANTNCLNGACIEKAVVFYLEHIYLAPKLNTNF